ncbi:MAG TPA: 4Fe-4S binding protein [Gammaproteobacteria bacterium]
MIHPGLPEFWVYVVWCFMLALALWGLARPAVADNGGGYASPANTSLITPLTRIFTHSGLPLLLLKLIMVALFALVIFAGLYGTPLPEQNIATVLTWNIWWAGLILSIFFLGSSWCAVCPWDTLASWLVKPKLWFTRRISNSLELTPPAWLRSVWPALILFIGLTWLELGVGVTTSPYATAMLALLMVVLATITLAIYKNKAFCHYICPIGRTVGFYSQLAPVELRPIDSDICAKCTTLECYNGNGVVDPCPTQLVMGRLQQNTYCTSCGNCVKSCPDHNVAWRLRPHGYETSHSARPRIDEAWFMLILLATTAFHGITMMEFWEEWLRGFAQRIGDSGQLLMSFSSGLIISIIIPVALYSLSVAITRHYTHAQISFKKLFTGMVFITLPLAFSYHLAHNLNHLVREGSGAIGLFSNPLGLGAQPMSDSEILAKHLSPIVSESVVFTAQGLLMMFGFWLAIRIMRHRALALLPGVGWRLFPFIVFILSVHGFHLWMLSQPMIMRIGLCIVP